MSVQTGEFLTVEQLTLFIVSMYSRHYTRRMWQYRKWNICFDRLWSKSTVV